MSDDFYLKAVKKLYKGYQNIIGAAAIGIASKNSNISTNEDGEIEDFNGGKEELGEFVEDFKNTIGDVAVRIGREKVNDLDIDGELPDILQGDDE